MNITDTFIVSMLARASGEILSNHAACMTRALAHTLEETEIILAMPVDFEDPSSRERLPYMVEADDSGFDFYMKAGPERRLLLSFERSSEDVSQFSVVGGEYADALPFK